MGQIAEEMTKQYYATCDILVFPTFDHEGFAMSLFQSVAAGLPIITTKIRAAAQYLREPDNCLWVEPKNPEMIADKIVFLLQHPSVRESMSMNNRTLALGFSETTVATEFCRIYQVLLCQK
jgi:glycosyltransferase involved in cell wall biosynthesis